MYWCPGLAAADCRVGFHVRYDLAMVHFSGQSLNSYSTPWAPPAWSDNVALWGLLCNRRIQKTLKELQTCLSQAHQVSSPQPEHPALLQKAHAPAPEPYTLRRDPRRSLVPTVTVILSVNSRRNLPCRQSGFQLGTWLYSDRRHILVSPDRHSQNSALPREAEAGAYLAAVILQKEDLIS